MDIYFYPERNFTSEELEEGLEILKDYGFRTNHSYKGNKYIAVFGEERTNLKAVVQFGTNLIQIEIPDENSLKEFDIKHEVKKVFFQNLLFLLIAKFKIKSYNSSFPDRYSPDKVYDLSMLKIKKIN